MAGNPLIDQGVLNRIRGSVQWADFPGLNVTAPFLDREGINLRKKHAKPRREGQKGQIIDKHFPINASNVAKTK